MFSAGKVKAIHGVDEVQRQNLANNLAFHFQAGDMLEDAADDRDRPGYFIVLGENREETDQRANRIKELVRIEYEPF